MKFRLAAVSFIFICIFFNCLVSSPQNINFNLRFKRTSYNLSALDAESDAISNITHAEDLIFANFEILLGTELNQGDVWYLYLGLAISLNYLNKAESLFFNSSYNSSISKAKRAKSIAEGILPLSLFKGIESLSNKEFKTIILPIFVIIIIISLILGIILIIYAKKSYYRKKDQDLLKKKIIISNNQTKVNK